MRTKIGKKERDRIKDYMYTFLGGRGEILEKNCSINDTFDFPPSFASPVLTLLMLFGGLQNTNESS